MKNRNNLPRILILTIMLFVAGQSHALYTTYLDGVSNYLSGTYAYLTNLPSPTRADKATTGLIKRALRDLSKPSTSVPGDYGLFVMAVQHLGRLALTNAVLLEAGSNVFNAFTNDAQAEIIATADRIAALSDFVPTKRSAGIQLAQAQLALDRIGTLTDIKIALLVGRQVFVKIVAANRLAAIGEAHPGFAPESVVGVTLTHQEHGNTGTVHFDDATQATQTDSSGTNLSDYIWTRTGLNTATLVLTESSGSTTVKLHFTSATGGTFIFRNMDSSSGAAESGSGRFNF